MDALSNDKITASQRLDFLVRQWQTAVQTQMHFNEIEWKIRALGLAAMTAVLSVAFSDYAARTSLTIRNINVPLSTTFLVGASVLWYIFYFADYHWYHPLLKGATKAATKYEKRIYQYLNIGDSLESQDLTQAISAASHTRWMRIKMFSSRKIRIFYGLGFIPLLGGALLTWIA